MKAAAKHLFHHMPILLPDVECEPNHTNIAVVNAARSAAMYLVRYDWLGLAGDHLTTAYKLDFVDVMRSCSHLQLIGDNIT